MRGRVAYRKLAEGSAVELFLAQAGPAKTLVQVCRPDVLTDPELLGEFVDASVRSTRERHPAVLAPKKSGCSRDGRFLVATAPLSGVTARDWLNERGPVPASDVVFWAVSLTEALEHLHQQGVVHGNLCPETVFLDGPMESPDVRLLDTRLMLFRSKRSLLMHPSRVLVQPQYLAPERVAGQRATPASDVYGLGVLLYELLVGKPPFLGQTPIETRMLHLAGIAPGLPPHLFGFSEVLAWCLALEPERRFESMLELRQAILSVDPSPPPQRDWGAGVVA